MAATVDDLSRLIDLVSKLVAKDYPDIEWQDVRQELIVFVLKNGKSIKLKEEGGNPRWLLERVAQTYAKDERSKHLILTSQYAYKPSDVKKILETAFFSDQVDQTHIPEDAVSLDKMDALDLKSDIMIAYGKLKPELKEAIFRRYVLNEVPSNHTYERKRFNKAINELTYRLNNYRGRDDLNRRVVMSNSQARANLSNFYDGERPRYGAY